MIWNPDRSPEASERSYWLAHHDELNAVVDRKVIFIVWAFLVEIESFSKGQVIIYWVFEMDAVVEIENWTLLIEEMEYWFYIQDIFWGVACFDISYTYHL